MSSDEIIKAKLMYIFLVIFEAANPYYRLNYIFYMSFEVETLSYIRYAQDWFKAFYVNFEGRVKFSWLYTYFRRGMLSFK